MMNRVVLLSPLNFVSSVLWICELYCGESHQKDRGWPQQRFHRCQAIHLPCPYT